MKENLMLVVAFLIAMGLFGWQILFDHPRPLYAQLGHPKFSNATWKER